MAEGLDLAVLAWAPLGRGLLTGKYSADGSTGDRRARLRAGDPRLSERNLEISALVGEVAAELNAKPAEAVKIYAASEKSKSSVEELLRDVKSEGIKYSMTPTGLMKVSTFMQKIGMIKTVPPSWKDYAFEHLHGLPGS